MREGRGMERRSEEKLAGASINGAVPSKRIRIFKDEAEGVDSVMHMNADAFFAA